MDPFTLRALICIAIWIIGVIVGLAIANVISQSTYLSDGVWFGITFWPLTIIVFAVYYAVVKPIFCATVLWTEWVIKLFNPNHNVKENFLKHIK